MISRVMPPPGFEQKPEKARNPTMISRVMPPPGFEQKPDQGKAHGTTNGKSMMITPYILMKMMLYPKRKSIFLIGDTIFEVDPKYTPVKLLGSGSYGTVCSFINKETDEKVAIKKVRHAFYSTKASLNTLREIRILKHLNHPNVIRMKDVMLPNQRLSFEETYLVYELMDANLDKFLRSDIPLSADDCRHFILQILKALKYLHNANILHRDLKPDNIFIDYNRNVKIGDFGLARTAITEYEGQDADWFFTDYVVSRWYRAPELLLGCPYGKAIDIWSVGCIFAELLTRKPLLPGDDKMEQLDLILLLLGRQDELDVDFVSTEKWKQYVLRRSADLEPGIDMFKVFPEAERLAVDLLRRMLVFNPAYRITVAEALHHPYFCEVYDPMLDVAHLEPIDVEVKGVADVSSLRAMVWKEIVDFYA